MDPDLIRWIVRRVERLPDEPPQPVLAHARGQAVDRNQAAGVQAGRGLVPVGIRLEDLEVRVGQLRPALVHLDLYRLEQPASADELFAQEEEEAATPPPHCPT